MTIKRLIKLLESVAPPALQESYDNAGLIVGNASNTIKGVLLCLDSTEAVIDEAIRKKCNLVIAHHPIVFKGLKTITGKNYVERVIIKAIKKDIAIYAIHTNLDNVYHNGVNEKIAQRIGLVNTQILAPKKGLKKLFTFVPGSHSEKVRNALFQAGAGQVNGFEHLSYSGVGLGTQKVGGNPEVKLEVLFPATLQSTVLKALKKVHPGNNIPYDIMEVESTLNNIGAGIIGKLPKSISATAFLKRVKRKMRVRCIRHTQFLRKPIKKVAVCGGAGGFLLPNAIAAGADIFITADYKYHEFFDADGKIIIADIGHYESEQFTIDLLYEIITNKFSTFAAHCTEINSNPVKYL